MRKSKAEKLETRKHIVEVAAQMFKKHGIGATGVGEIMAAAGLTHSAFYRHFESKDELIAEASSTSLDVFVEAAKAAAASGPDTFVKYLQDYLSTEYRDKEMGGCPVVQTGGELALADAPIRQGVSDGLAKLLDLALTFTDGSAEAEADTIFTMSALLGAITLSRLINDAPLSEHILDVTRQRLARQPDTTQKKPKRTAPRPVKESA
ncbi:TetR/AcrR family transcriptional repressor of nem operon [Paraburkholderia sp. GAS199]|uniref:TetR/AcrR family transcriptional regulator n=1 Tax=Paraburkholderia sp. GAS199 TaxID=3035126 RepID=UPI003D1F21B0